MSGTVSSCRDAANRYFTERYPGYRLDNFRTEKGGFTTFYLSFLKFVNGDSQVYEHLFSNL